MTDHASGRRAFLAKVSSLSAAIPGMRMRESLASLGRRGAWDDSWTTRLGPSHRIVFDWSLPEEQFVYNLVDLMDLYHEALGTTDADLHCVVVVRFAGIPMVFKDAFWQELALGTSAKINDPATGAPATRNIYATKSANGARPGIADLQQRGVIFLACNRAAMHYTNDVKTGSPEEKQEHIRNAVLPGVILQPTGIYALVRAQDVGCVRYPG